MSLGQWHKVELFLDRSTGVVQWWMDDTLIGNVRMPFNAAGFTEVVFSPTWGGLGETKARDDYFWFDHVHVSIGR